MVLFISAGDGEDAGFDQLLKALMGFVHDKQTALDNGPLLVDLNIRGGKALADTNRETSIKARLKGGKCPMNIKFAPADI